MIKDKTIDNFLNEVASNTPTPGGGSCSAIMAALGASLVLMACQMTLNRTKFKAYENEINELLAFTKIKQEALIKIANDDCLAYEEVVKAYKLPKETQEEKALRDKMIQVAYKKAIITPKAILLIAYSLANKVKEVHFNPNAISDFGVSLEALLAGAKGAYMNIQINLKMIKDKTICDKENDECSLILADIENIVSGLLTKVNDILENE